MVLDDATTAALSISPLCAAKACKKMAVLLLHVLSCSVCHYAWRLVVAQADLTLVLMLSVAKSTTAMVPPPVQHHRSDPATARQCTMLPKAFAGTS